MSDQLSLLGEARQDTPSVVLSYGLGVDSTAILLRWLLEPSSRDFALSDLLVITAMTGDEWSDSITMVEEHVLPLLREHGVRYVQVARASSSQSDGIVVLDDSTAPTVVHGRGAYTLSQELLAAGTIPQRGGARLCSAKSKGFPLDAFIARATAGNTYRHAIGFEKDEERRARKDAAYNSEVRTGWYPLIDWGWDRQACLDYIAEHLAVTWRKSACVQCPFAWSTAAGRTAATARYEDSPGEAVEAMIMEYVAMALNPAQTLTDVPLVTLVGPSALAAFTERLDAAPHALYDVRRVLRPHRDDPARLANAARSVRSLATGSAQEMRRELESRARAAGASVVDDGLHVRAWVRQRPETFPGVEHLLTIAPAVVDDKQLPQFEQWWHELTSAQQDMLAIA